MQNKKAIIIGSGVAGLSVAIRLRLKGYEVVVYEKNGYPGGKLHAFKKDGFCFDTGPSLFTQPQNIEELFLLADEPIEKYFSYKPLQVTCKYFYENGKIAEAFSCVDALAEELKQQLNEDGANVISYLQQSARAYNTIGSIFLDNSLHKRKTWLNRKVIKACTAVKPAYLFKSLNGYNQKHFSSAETVQLFNRFATYNGSNPYKAPAMLSIIPHLELNEGIFYPDGGMISITNALLRLAKDKGVQFYFNSPVQRIIHTEGKVKGVVVAEKNIVSDIVVSNSDIYFTYKELLNDPVKTKKIAKQERSSSAVIFYWGINKTFPQLQLHNIFFSNDYKKEFDNIFIHKKISDDLTVYVNVTSKMENEMAPEGMENWFVMLNVPANFGQDWEEAKEQLKTAVVNKLSRLLGEEILPLIVTEETLDPLMIEEQTSSYRGSLYGTSSNSRWSAFLRHANFTNGIKGLYFCGGSVHPGGGIPLCLKSAKIVSELIAGDFKEQK